MRRIQSIVRYSLLALALVAACEGTCHAAELNLHLGDSVEQVYDALGTPRGRFTRGSIVFLIYEAGSIGMKDNKVLSINTYSGKTVARKRAAKRAALKAEALADARELAELNKPTPIAPAHSTPARNSPNVIPPTTGLTGATKPPPERQPKGSTPKEPTKEEKRDARKTEVTVEISRIEKAIKDLSNRALGIRRRREKRAHLAELKEQLAAVDDKADDADDLKQHLTKQVQATEKEIRDLGNSADTIRRRREARSQLDKLQQELTELNRQD
jgi:hypothetical protein